MWGVARRIDICQRKNVLTCFGQVENCEGGMLGGIGYRRGGEDVV